jgi:amidase
MTSSLVTETQAWELASWDGVETLKRIRSGEVSASEVIEAAIVRTEQASGLNAIVTPTLERARSEVLRRTGPFAGVPMFTKDLAQVAGVRTAWGTAASGTFISVKSDPCVTTFESLGFVSLGKSATPEFGLTASTEPLAFGATLNPWDSTRTTGGSSGGAAALVASGIVPMAHASDGGGSIRIPASCCGLVGLKPSRGRFDMEGSALLPVNVAVHGMVTRTVRDTVEFWRALTAAVPSELAPIDVVNPAPSRPLHISMVTTTPRGVPLDGEVRATLEDVARRLERLGHHVDPRPCPFSQGDLGDFIVLYGLLGYLQAHLGRFLVHRAFDSSLLDPWTLGLARSFAADKWAGFKRLLRLRNFTQTWADAMASTDVFLLPTLAALPPLLGHLKTDVPFLEKQERLTLSVPFTSMINAAGAPALTLPLGRTASGLPIGVQFAAAMGHEQMLLELGLQLEADAPWPRLAPRPH